MSRVREIVDEVRKLINRFGQRVFVHFPVLKKTGYLLWMLSPSRFISILDQYIIKRFIGTYIYTILLTISIVIVFDFSENLSKFTQYYAPWRAVIFDYCTSLALYYSNLLSPLSVFIAVIFFTPKLTGSSGTILMMATGMFIGRLTRPYMISYALVAGLIFYPNSLVTPYGTVVRRNFESSYRNSEKNTSTENVQLFVTKNTIIYIQHCDDQHKRGYGFSLARTKNKKIVSYMIAMKIQYNTVADMRYH